MSSTEGWESFTWGNSQALPKPLKDSGDRKEENRIVSCHGAFACGPKVLFEDLREEVQGQPGPHSKFETHMDYITKSSLIKPKRARDRHHRTLNIL